MSKHVLEVGARTLDDVLAAERGGADRVEIYASPLEGALTPSAGLIKTAAEAVSTMKIYVMIRPRAGDFLYSDAEFETMRKDVETAVAMGVDGVMCGILKANGDLDVDRMSDLKTRASGANFVLHRAFDFSNDPFRALREAVDLGCDSILTLGQERDAAFSRETLRELMSEAGDKIKFVIALGADFETKTELPDVVREIGASEYHIVNGYRKRQSKMDCIREKGNNDDYLKDAMSMVEYLSEDAVRECRGILDAL
ncbi:MAG: hypothetical protein KAG97_00385 [Victivallales bacterium]|nr:hypothetical protein [Victivallales bacterium]